MKLTSEVTAAAGDGQCWERSDWGLGAEASAGLAVTPSRTGSGGHANQFHPPPVAGPPHVRDGPRRPPHPDRPNHPWTTVIWGSHESLDPILVVPELVAEVSADTAVDRGAWRHTLRFIRLRLDVAVADVPRFGEGVQPSSGLALSRAGATRWA